jgi:dTMP kinase
MSKGKFVVIEGLDLSGKSTQVGLLEKILRKRGVDVISTREHTRDGLVGQLIEKIVNRQGKLPPIALQLLFVADRLDHLERVVLPAIKAGKIVICDRYYWSTIAYGSLVADRDWLLEVHKYCPEPDLTIYLDIDPEKAIQRLSARGEKATIFEKQDKMKKQTDTYYWLLANNQAKSVKVVADQSPEAVLSDIIKVLENRKII